LLSSTKLVEYSINGDAGTCNVVEKVGYFRDSSNYKNVIKCDSSKNCSISDSLTYDGTKCTPTNNGKLLTTNYNTAICIDGSTGTVQRFSGTEDHAYGPSSIFGSATGYYKVKVSEDSIVLDKTGGKFFFLHYYF